MNNVIVKSRLVQPVCNADTHQATGALTQTKFV